MEKMIAIRLDAEHMQKLDAIVKMTGWNQSEVIRRLIDNAAVTPPSLTTDVSAKKGEPLVVARTAAEKMLA